MAWPPPTWPPRQLPSFLPVLRRTGLGMRVAHGRRMKWLSSATLACGLSVVAATAWADPPTETRASEPSVDASPPALATTFRVIDMTPPPVAMERRNIPSMVIGIVGASLGALTTLTGVMYLVD